MKAYCKIEDKNINGIITFEQFIGYSKITFKLSGFNPNKVHGIHIHEFSDLSNGCLSLGSHYNPYNKQHGNIIIHHNDRHAGDLINNLVTDDGGNFNYSYNDPLVVVKDIINRSVVIHEGRDDLGLYRNNNKVPVKQREGSSTTGNSGGRIACGIITEHIE